MERRGFLKSLIGGITSAGVLVKATPAEIAAFGAKTEQPIILSPQAIAPPARGGYGGIQPGATLYDASGQAVAIVRALDIQREMIDVTSWASSTSQYISGAIEVTVIATGLSLPTPAQLAVGRPAAWVCGYCGTDTLDARCPSCGAPRR